MGRRSFLKFNIAFIFFMMFGKSINALAALTPSTYKKPVAPAKGWKSLTKEEWKKRLTPEQFYVLREDGTERRRTSPLDKEYGRGVYVCAGCGTALFTSEMKYDSGTGWPSFFSVLKGRVVEKEDNSFFQTRTEYSCATCDGHQGHVFNDGPRPTGLRYCNNGVALEFIAKPTGDLNV